jgi:branched-chain amino acid transport system ATP-binding protein
LETRGVTASYGKVIALRGVSFDIHEGGIFGLIGANGSGKSTMLKAISGLIRPTTGSIHFEGNRIVGLGAHEIVQLGISLVPEGRRIFSKMDVSENLKMGAYARKGRKALEGSKERVFEYFPILHTRIHQNAGLLSGGEQQMLAIARSLMANPKLLMLDEPTLGLSPMMSLQIGKIISEIRDDGISIILAEQNARLALRVTEEACVFETGRIILEGSTKGLSENEEIRKAYL